MRKFIITSAAWTGEAEIVYDEKGQLVRISFENCTVSDHHRVVANFKQRVSTDVNGLQASFAATSATVIETSFEVTFDMFWKAYDNKINRKRAISLWDKLSKTDAVKAYYGVATYHKFLKKEKWRKQADPETYLRNNMWENEYK